MLEARALGSSGDGYTRSVTTETHGTAAGMRRGPPTPAGNHGPAKQGTLLRVASPLALIMAVDHYQPLTGGLRRAERRYHGRDR